MWALALLGALAAVVQVSRRERRVDLCACGKRTSPAIPPNKAIRICSAWRVRAALP